MNQKKVTAIDVASYIFYRSLNRRPLTVIKLQGLLYYCRAWSLAWNDDKLFEDDIYALRYGPRIKSIYELFKGTFKVKEITNAHPQHLTLEQKKTIHSIVNTYGVKKGQWLTKLIIMETPWQAARENNLGDHKIKLDLMLEFYRAVGLAGTPI